MDKYIRFISSVARIVVCAFSLGSVNAWQAKDSFWRSEPKISNVRRNGDSSFCGVVGLDVMVVAMLTLEVWGVAFSSGSVKRDVSPPRTVSVGPGRHIPFVRGSPGVRVVKLQRARKNESTYCLVETPIPRTLAVQA